MSSEWYAGIIVILLVVILIRLPWHGNGHNKGLPVDRKSLELLLEQLTAMQSERDALRTIRNDLEHKLNEAERKVGSLQALTDQLLPAQSAVASAQRDVRIMDVRIGELTAENAKLKREMEK